LTNAEKERVNMYMRKLIAGSVVALGVVGVGVAAAAVGSDSGAESSAADTTTTLVPEPTTTTTVTPTTTTVAPIAPVADASPTQDVERSTEGCGGETFANHGAYVSSVAHDPDRQPGDVAAAAQSACGKPVSSLVDDPADDEESDSDAPDTAESESAHGSASSNHGNGNATGHG
jgi:hypothetical protein